MELLYRNDFQEAHSVEVLAPGEAVGKDWDVVLIEAGRSLNNNFYPAAVLRVAVPRFEGVKACAYRFGGQFDHLPQDESGKKPGNFVENVVGWFHGVRFGSFKRPDGTQGEGLLARFHILEGHEWLRKNLRDAWKNGNPNLLGFSIDAQGQAKDGIVDGKRVSIVERIDKVTSTDIVSEPAAGGAVLRLVASVKEGKVDQFVELIKRHRPTWLEGMTGPADGETDYAIRVLETNLDRAKKLFEQIPGTDEKKLLEVAQAMKMLGMIMALLQSGKVEEAMKMLRDMIASLPAEENPSDSEPKESDGEAPPQKESEANEEENKMKENAEKELKEKEEELAIRETTLKIKEKVLESGLPELAQARVVKIFEGKSEISDEILEKAIEEERAYIASFSESGKPDGLGGAHSEESTVEVTLEERAKLDKAFDGMFAGRDVDNVPMFTSLKEAWGACTGGKWSHPDQLTDWIYESIALSLPQSFRQDRAQHSRNLKESWGQIASRSLREAVTTTDFPVAFGDALFRRLQKEYNDDPLSDWRQIISATENLSDATNDMNIIRLGATSTLPVVNQNAPYQELTPVTPTEEVEKITPQKFGGLFKLTWEDVLADRVGVIRRIPRMLARSSNRTIHEAVWDEIETNPTLVTGNALISGANNNLVSGSPALSYAAVADAIRLLRDQTELDSGKRLGLNPKWLLVGTNLENEAIEITDSDVKQTAAEDATVINAVRRMGLSSFPTLGLGRSGSTEDRWWIVADPKDAETIAIGFLGGRDRPEIFIQGRETPLAGAFFDADAITFKVRLVFGVQVIDHRFIVGSLV